MLEGLQDVPPAVVLLLTEVAVAPDYVSARKRLKTLLPELRRQSEVYEAESQISPRVPSAPGKFAVYMDGGLNLFDGDVGCREITCRQGAAMRLVRSIGLFADTIWITDFITEKFCRFGRVTNKKLDEVLTDTMVLAVLAPLIVDGIVKFRSPWIAACKPCLTAFDAKVDDIADSLLLEYGSEFALDRKADGYSLLTGELYDPPLVLRLLQKGGSSEPPAMKEYAQRLVRRAVRSALWTGRDAAEGRGAILSNSKLGLAGLARQEGRVRTGTELQMLDENRNVILPWVSDLTPSQIVQLRYEASKALPSLRELLAKQLTAASTTDDERSALDTINELRQQAVDVRNELENTKQHANRFWKTSYFMLGLGISAYGVMADQVAPALGGAASFDSFDHES